LNARGWLLGGEGSGHLLALDRHTTGDGIISALQVLQAVQRQGRSLAAMLEGVVRFPQVMINVRLAPGVPGAPAWAPDADFQLLRDAVEFELAGRGRVLIRASGTEPVLRVMVEADDEPLARRCAQRLADAVAATQRTLAAVS
jgi:phosphoglucosamine mutase